MAKFNKKANAKLKKANAKLKKRQQDHADFMAGYSRAGLAPRFLGGFHMPGSTNRHQG